MKNSLLHRALVALAVLVFVKSNWAADDVFIRGKTAAVTVEDVRADAESRIPEEYRARVYSQPDTIGKIALNLYVRRVMAEKAKAAGLDTDAAVSAALQVARDKILSDAWLAKLDQTHMPTEAVVERLARALYVGKSNQYKVPEKVKVRHILVAGTDDAAKVKAEQLLKEVKAGADFASLAKQYSADPGSAARGGEIGPFARGDMVKEFQDAAFAMKTKGELSELVQTRYGFHIIQFDERFPENIKSFEELKDQIGAEVRADLLQKNRAQVAQAIESEAELDKNAVKAFVDSQKNK